ncbi:endonuclease [Tanacetum coccineum]|uniref:Endonuclease n=1 Tax=Tanacetum coccineum TaxID=301880 RepID=A0ABQ5IYD5_9ASTR
MYDKSLDYQSLGVGNLEELLGKMAEVAVLIEDKNKVKYVLSAPVLKRRRGFLKHEVSSQLSRYSNRIMINYFDELYKDHFTIEMDYHYYGVSNLEELCKLLSRMLVVEDGEIRRRKL